MSACIFFILRYVYVIFLFCRCKPRKFLENNMLLAHVAKGLYAHQLRRWFALFGRENIKVRRRSGFFGCSLKRLSQENKKTNDCRN